MKNKHYNYRYQQDQDKSNRRDRSLIKKLNQENRFLYQNVKILIEENRELRNIITNPKGNIWVQNIVQNKQHPQDIEPTVNRKSCFKSQQNIDHDEIKKVIYKQQKHNLNKGTFISELSESKFKNRTQKFKYTDRKGIEIVTEREKRKSKINYINESLENNQKKQIYQGLADKMKYIKTDIQQQKKVYMQEGTRKIQFEEGHTIMQQQQSNNNIYKLVNPQILNRNQPNSQKDVKKTPEGKLMHKKKDNSPYLQINYYKNQQNQKVKVIQNKTLDTYRTMRQPSYIPSITKQGEQIQKSIIIEDSHRNKTFSSYKYL